MDLDATWSSLICFAVNEGREKIIVLCCLFGDSDFLI